MPIIDGTKIANADVKLTALQVTSGQFIPVGIDGNTSSIAIDLVVLGSAILAYESESSIYQLKSAKGEANGYAPLGSDSIVPASYLPTPGGTGVLTEPQLAILTALEAAGLTAEGTTDIHLVGGLRSESKLQSWVDDGTFDTSIWSSLPITTTSSLGIMQVGTGLSVINGVVSISGSVSTINNGYYNSTGDLLFYEEATFITLIEADANDIYIDISTNIQYRWSGTAYVEINPSLILGEGATNAYYGDKGKIAYDHSQSTHILPNAAITGATKTKITYDSKGLVTSGVNATTSDINDSNDRRYVLESQKAILESLVNSGLVEIVGENTLLFNYNIASKGRIQSWSDDGTGLPQSLLDDLPIASTSSTGIVQIGDGLSITIDGLLSADLEGIGVTDGNKGDITVSSSGAVWTVEDDSHNHLIENVDELQTALDSKLTGADGIAFDSYRLGTILADNYARLDIGQTFSGGIQTTFNGVIAMDEGGITFENNAYINSEEQTYLPIIGGVTISTILAINKTTVESGFVFDANGNMIVRGNIQATGGIQSWTDGSFDPTIWESLPITTPTSLGIMQAGSGLSVTNGIVDVVGGGTAAIWGQISGTLSDQTDLQSALDLKFNAADFTKVNVEGLSINITESQISDLQAYEIASNKGISLGYAPLDEFGYIPTAHLPSFVDDVLEFTSLSVFPTTGETGKIYIALDTNKTYRWSGSTYIYITSGAVDSVNGFTGVINLTTSHIPEGTNLYYTDTRVAAKVTKTFVEGLGISITESQISDFGSYEPSFSKNTAFNKNFGTTVGTVAEGSDSRFAKAETAYSWGDWSTGVDKTFVDALGVNAASLGGVSPTNYARTDIDETFNGAITFNDGTVLKDETSVQGNLIFEEGGLLNGLSINDYYHSGNSNLSTVDWTAKDLMAASANISGSVFANGYGRTTHQGGGLVGGHNNIGSTITKSNPIYSIGTDFLPAEDTLGNMYGVGYTHASASFINSTDLGTTPSSWGMYVAAGGNARIFLDGSYGNIHSKGNIYSEEGIFRGILKTTATTASTSTTTGALLSAGGLGVAGDANIGGNITTVGIIATKNKYEIRNSSGTLKWTIGLNGDTLEFKNIDGTVEATLSQVGTLLVKGKVQSYAI